MTIEAIANRLVEICRAGNWNDAYRELFASDAKAYEMEGVPDRITEGVATLIAKGEAHAANWETVHEIVISDPLVFGNFFSVGMRIDVTRKDGVHEIAEEMCVYEVKDGKVIAERFFYSMG
ncbi:MAG: SnoaL-like domain-containing protein [Bacteroidota bacterium]